MSFSRAALLATTILCAPLVANAACPGTGANCPSPTYNNLTVGGTATLNGTVTGTGIDLRFSAPDPIGSVTPNAGTFSTLTTTGQTQFGAVKWIYANLPASPAAADTALAAAITQCSALGTKLIIPQGKYRLNGSHAATLLDNCSIEGSGVSAVRYGFDPPGTMFELTSTSVPPFRLGTAFAVKGLGFFWPNQTGAVVYPELFADGTTTQTGPGLIENNTVVNAYRIFKQTSPLWGQFRILHNTFYAVDSVYSLYGLGDGFNLANNRYLPVWLGYGGSPAAVGVISQHNKIFDIYSGGAVNINGVNEVAVGWQYGIYVNSGGRWAESQYNATWDVVGTIIDTSAGGIYSFGNVFTGQNASCALSGNVWGVGGNGGQQSCFNFGSASGQEFALDNFQSNGSQGDFITTAGASIILTNSVSLSIGSVLAASPGAGEFYQVRVTAAGTPEIRVQNNRFSGYNANSHVHGVAITGAGVPSIFMAQNNTFIYHQEAISGSYPAGANISGNNSRNTNGTVSFTQAGPGAILYYGNFWDKPPLPTLTSCGTSPSVSSGGTYNSGFFTVGTGSVLSCVFHTPINTYGKCQFQPSSAITLGAAPSGVPAAWTISSYVGAAPFDMNAQNIFYSCAGM